jgi:two-component system CheB/CheR fusion protein
MNDESRVRANQLDELNAYLSSILASMQVGLVVVDRDLHVLSWNRAAEGMWGLRADEVRDQTFMNLDIGLPVERLVQPLRDCLAGDSSDGQLTVDAVNRRGKKVRVKVSCTPLLGWAKDIRGVILLMDDEQRE